MLSEVVIIDSGLNRDVFRQNDAGGVRYYIESDYINMDYKYDDDNGHGRKCAAIIKKKIAHIKIYTIKILDENLLSSEYLLECALEHCLALNIKVINLSLSLVKYFNGDKIRVLCKKLYEQDKIVVSAVENGKNFSYPAAFDTVLGVIGNAFDKEAIYWFDKNKRIQGVADLLPEFTERELQGNYLFSGNSKACAWIAGQVLECASDQDSFDDVLDKLENRAECKNWEYDDISRSYQHKENECIDEGILEIVKHIVLKEFEPGEDLSGMNLFECGILNEKNILTYVYELEKQFCIKIPDGLINYRNFVSVKEITNMISVVKNDKIS